MPVSERNRRLLRHPTSIVRFLAVTCYCFPSLCRLLPSFPLAAWPRRASLPPRPCRGLGLILNYVNADTANGQLQQYKDKERTAYYPSQSHCHSWRKWKWEGGSLAVLAKDGDGVQHRALRQGGQAARHRRVVDDGGGARRHEGAFTVNTQSALQMNDTEEI